MRMKFLGAILLLVLLCAPAEAVFNGQFLKGPEFHWVVKVITPESSCSGALVAADWVLTARHCLDRQMAVQIVDYPRDFDFERYQDMDELLKDYQGRIRPELDKDFLISERRVAQVYHRADEDVALLKLERPFTNVSHFAPVATMGEAESLKNNSYTEVVVAGFGVNGKLGRPLEEALYGMFKYYYVTALERPIIPLASALLPSNIYETPRGFRPSLNDPEPGPGGGGQAITGYGDSGGPLLAFIDGQWRIIGVNSLVLGGLRWRKYVLFGGNLEMPSHARHVKVNDSSLCSLLYLAGAGSAPAELRCP